MGFLFGALHGQVLENYNPKIVIEHKYELIPSSVIAIADLNLKDYPMSSFQLEFPEKSAVFLGDKLWLYAVSDTSFVIPMEQLKKISGENTKTLSLMVYKEGIDSDQLSVKKGVFRKGRPVAGGVNVPNEQLREKDTVKDFMILAFVVVLALVALFKVTYPMVFQSVLRPVSLFQEEFSEGSSGMKLFSSDVIFYMLVFSMLMSLFAFSYLHFAGIGLLDEFLGDGLNSLLLIWLSGSVIFMVMSFLKYLWIKIFAVVYHLDKIDFSQFFYMVKSLMLVLLILYVVVMGFYLQGYTAMDEMMNYAVWLFLVVYLVGIFRLFYLMLKKVPFKSYHLFSYLCSSELVPFLVIVKLIVG
ncbi:DUF4271 domain-containing protein [Echinicola soli]|uniref:DUF4271 domain-containing protein n=2 Tax=Echinicola soli TaxID=2591634 RepID=A0A514CNW0_9BACT|nr:DUF4271 domain-containing protein [Echinicola soli]